MNQVPSAPQAEQRENSRSVGKILGILTLFTFVTYIPAWLLSAFIIADVNIGESVFDTLAFAALLLWNSGPLVDALAFLLCRKDVKNSALKICKRAGGDEMQR